MAIHSIIRCPDEILQLIFEELVELYGTERNSSLKASNRLAFVCHAWRRVALRTPRLWSYIHFSMKEEGHRFEAYWTMAMERTKGVLLNFRVYDICSQWGRNLSRIANKKILSLHLDFMHHRDMVMVHKLWKGRPTSVMDLSVSFGPSHGGLSVFEWLHNEFQGIHGDGDQLLRLVHCRQQLSLTGASRSTFDGIMHAPLTHLSLNDITIRENVFEAFPLLISLTLHRASLRSPATMTTAPNLLHLELQSSSFSYAGFPSLRRLTCDQLPEAVLLPSLTDFHWLGSAYYHPHQDLMNFLSSHPTITNVSTDINYTQEMQLFTEFASQISRLTLNFGESWNGCRWFPIIASPDIFTDLSILTLVDDGGLSAQEFKTIVKARCLPFSHSLSISPRPARLLDEFAVNTRRVGFNRTRWSGTKLYDQAVKKVVRLPDDRLQVALTWPSI